MTPQEPQDSSTWPAWATERVKVVDYDPSWAARGAHERQLLQEHLAPWLHGHVEHVGSTAIPGLAAKPILDLQAPVQDLAVAEQIAPLLATHHWHYVHPDLDQRPYRRFFVKVIDGRRAAHLHLLPADSPRWHQQLAFRDALRTHPELVRAYAQLKDDLAARYPDDREAYTVGKQQFVDEVLTRDC
jgi:GrpB-like predicted nucleotidyltransferase (UPF0157 family)